LAEKDVVRHNWATDFIRAYEEYAGSSARGGNVETAKAGTCAKKKSGKETR